MARGPVPQREPHFEVTDANADIDGALEAIDRRLTIIRKLGRLGEPEAERLRQEEMTSLGRAEEMILRDGLIEARDVPWVRLAVACLDGNEERAGRWLPEAGPFTEPRTFADAWGDWVDAAERSREAERRAEPPLRLPEDPEFRRVREIVGELVPGAHVRPFDHTRDLVPPADLQRARDFLISRGLRFETITPELDLEALRRESEAVKSFDVAPFLKPMDRVMEQLLAEGQTHGWHATSLFTANLVHLPGEWLRNASRISRDDYRRFWMAGSIEWRSDEGGFARYLQYDGLLDRCERAGIEFSPEGLTIGERGVLFKIDLAGYRVFRHLAGCKGLEVTGPGANREICAPCPPPPEFIRPVAVFDFTGRE